MTSNKELPNKGEESLAAMQAVATVVVALMTVFFIAMIVLTKFAIVLLAVVAIPFLGIMGGTGR